MSVRLRLPDQRQRPSTTGCVTTAIMVLVAVPAFAWADGGALLFSRQVDGCRIALFIAPASPRAGPVDFSVLVQSADSEGAPLDVPVTIQVHRAGQPEQRLGGQATRGATNKLFSAIQLDLKEPGLWHAEVTVHLPQGPVRTDADLELAPPLPSWVELAPWIGWPAGAILLFVIHQRLVRRRADHC